MNQQAPKLVIGIFIGGAGKRLGGVAKGLLKGPGGTSLAAALHSRSRAALPNAECVLVGHHARYEGFGLTMLDDEPAEQGPIGGLCALLRRAEATGVPRVIALACDLPYVSETLIRKLAQYSGPGNAVAPKVDGKWQSLFARYDVAPTLRAAESALENGQKAVYRVIEQLDMAQLPLNEEEELELVDWDNPEDVPPDSLPPLADA
jgi:molybdopterin-guanine dinucleotide biosynthesis protein A